MYRQESMYKATKEVKIMTLTTEIHYCIFDKLIITFKFPQ